MKPPSWIPAAFVFALTLVATPALATVCAVDDAPAATLLVPYFEVDLDDCGDEWGSLDTVFSVANATAQPVLAGVTLWSDWGVPLFGFQIYLPGLAARRVGLGDFLCDNELPQTGSAVSPHSPATGAPVAFPGCNDTTAPGAAPYYAIPAVSAAVLAHLREALTGQLSSLHAAFYGQDWGDNVARGYVTVDAITRCHLLFPSSPGYFSEDGVASDDNVLVGDWAIVYPANNSAHVGPAVALEASSLDFGSGDVTFYGRYTAYSGKDAREPLPTTFASPFAVAAPFDTTDQLIWRERVAIEASLTPTWPAGLPLDEQNVTWFDSDSIPYPSELERALPSEAAIDLVDYPVVTHAYTEAEVPYPVADGWQYSNLQNVQGAVAAGQAWFETRSRTYGRWDASRPAVALDSSCVDAEGKPKTVTVTATGGLAADPPTTMIFWADFEDGFDGWDAIVGSGTP